MIKSEKYLVLGANGFVGSNLVDQLSEDPTVDVRAFDRFSRPAQFLHRQNVEVFKGDIFNKDDVSRALAEVSFVIHAFSATTPFISDSDPYIDISSNVENTVKILDLCSEGEVRKVGFVSSGGAVYGLASEKGAVNEESAPLPVSPYGIGKLSIEHYLEYFKRKRNLSYVTFRLTNPYGPGQEVKNNQGVIPAFLEKVNKREPISVIGDGETSRDYIYIKDAARMMVGVFKANSEHSIYNIGSGQQTSLNQIIDIIREISQPEPVKVVHQDAPTTFLQKTQVDINRYLNEFGDPHLTEIHEGLRLTKDAFDQKSSIEL